jgi:hypothetical protein
VSATNVKPYEAEGFYFEFSPNGSPFVGTLRATDEAQSGPYEAELSLHKAGSRERYARKAADLYGMDGPRLERALNEVCTRRSEEVAAAAAQTECGAEQESGSEVPSEEAEALLDSPGVLDRYVEDVAKIRGVVRDRDALRLQTLVALGAQLAPLPNGKPAGANLILTAEAGRGKNYVCDAVASMLPEDFYMAFESASAKSLYYRAETDPGILTHRWIYPNEAEATDQLVELFRPLLSGGRASHLTVNKTGEGRNAAQELTIEGPASITIPTVRNKLDGQLQTRMLVAELPDYEGRVAEHSRAVSRQLLPDNAGEDHSPRIRAWRAALTNLTSVRRVVFLLEEAAFCFDSDEVSHGARLWTNLLGLMLAHAWLEQRNRGALELDSGERAIVATPEDYETAYAVFKATCERSVVNLSDTHRAILEAVYELSSQSTFDGFSLRKIADAAGIHHSTVAEHKTFLTKSAKLLKEVEGGLDLVSGAEPSWWRKGDALVGFPRPEQVWRWWEEGVGSASESARHARHRDAGGQDPHTYAENTVGQATRQSPDDTRHPKDSGEGARVSDGKTHMSDDMPDRGNSLSIPNTDDDGSVSGVSGGIEEGMRHRDPDPVSFDLRPGESATVEELRLRREREKGDQARPPCIHGYLEGKGCYLCDPNHPYRLKSEATT